MTMMLRRRRKLLAGAAMAAAITVGLVAGPFQFSSTASADGGVSCNTELTGPPDGPAVVSTARTAYGRVLVVGGTGDRAGCALYLLTSDQLQSLSGGTEPYACSDDSNPAGPPCDSYLWPALLTKGDAIAGPGVDPRLLSTVTRTDFPSAVAPDGSVQQVTYAGQPLYMFFLDEQPGETDGANLFDPVTNPTGTWYLVDPHGGVPASGRAFLQLETAPLNGTGDPETVVGASMNHGFELLPDSPFPVYTSSADPGHEGPPGPPHGHGPGGSSCLGLCAVYWPPVLTSGRPEALPDVAGRLGTIRRPDGTQQVTYDGKPLYLYAGDAYIPTIAGTKGIYGAGLGAPFGTTFNTVPPTPLP